jgi:hypothetical protein
VAFDVRKQAVLFRKKKPKNSAFLVRAVGNGALKNSKVSWFFFSKKNCFSGSYTRRR